MSYFDIYQYYSLMKQERIILAFKGEISHEVLVSIGESLKDKLSKEDVKQRVTRKVFAIFIELAQNIYHYSDERSIFNGSSTGCGIIVIRDREDHFMVMSGNLVENSKVQWIVDHCNHLNQLDKEHLKKCYRERLKKPRETYKIGGGVGLIDVIRKSGNPIDLKINSIDDQYSFLIFSIKINKDG